MLAEEEALFHTLVGDCRFRFATLLERYSVKEGLALSCMRCDASKLAACAVSNDVDEFIGGVGKEDDQGTFVGGDSLARISTLEFSSAGEDTQFDHCAKDIGKMKWKNTFIKSKLCLWAR